jgi:hypothetical protein
MTSDAALDAAAPPLFGYALGNFRTVPFTVMKIHFEIGGIPIARKGYSDSPIKAVFLKIEKKKAKIPVPAKSAIASVRIGPLSPLTFWRRSHYLYGSRYLAFNCGCSYAP